MTAPAELQLFTPNIGEAWLFGSTHRIGGSAFCYDLSDSVNIHLVKSGYAITTIANNVPNIGTFTWTVPLLLFPGSDYRIRVDDGTNMAQSDSDFSIELPFFQYLEAEAVTKT